MRTFACVSVLVSLGALSACSSRGLTIGGSGGLRDMTVTTQNPDFGNDGCMQLGPWPTNNDPFGLTTYFTPDYEDENLDDSIMEAFNQEANGNLDIFFAEIDVPSGLPPQYPATVTFSTQNTFEAPPMFGGDGISIASVFAYFNCDINQSCGNSDLEEYVAQAGTLTMQQVDDSENGTMAVTAMGIRLVQWSTDPNAPDSPLPNGKCIDVTSFSGSAPYTSQDFGDFGVQIDFAAPTEDLAVPVDLAKHD